MTIKFRNKLILILISITVCISIPLFPSGFYNSKDGELHLARISSYAFELKNGQFPVRWASKLNYGYGYPIFNFVYPLPYLFASLIHLGGISLFLSLKLTLISSMVLSAIFMYIAINSLLKSQRAALVSAFIYVLNPYRLLNIFIRAAIGESFAFIFPPLSIYFFSKWLKTKKIDYLVYLSFSLAALILSHNALSIMFISFLLPFFLLLLFNSKTAKGIDYLSICFSFLLSLLMSSFFWVPSLLELKYTLAQHYLFQKDFRDYFLTIKQLVFMPWEYKSDYRPAYLGIIPIFIFILFLKKTIRSKNEKNKATNLFLILSFIISIFLITDKSRFIWELLTIIQFFQLPWRFLSLSIFIISLITAYYIKQSPKLSNINTYALVLLIFIFSFNKFRVEPYVWKEESYFIKYPKSTTWHNEASPVWTAGESDSFPETNIEIIGDSQLVSFKKYPTAHYLKIESKARSKIINNTLYFPGWKLYINNQLSDIQFQDPQYRGLITFDLDIGLHDVKIVYEKTRIQIFAEYLSWISIIISLLAVLINLKKSRKNEFKISSR